MKALKVLNYIYSELSKNNTKEGVWIEPIIIKVAIDELENIKNAKHSNYPTITDTSSTDTSSNDSYADTSSKDSYASLEKRIKHIENTLEEIFRASAYTKDALNENNTVWNYFKSKQ